MSTPALFLVKKPAAQDDPERMKAAVDQEIQEFLVALGTARQMYHDPRYRALVTARRFPARWRSEFVTQFGFEPSGLTTCKSAVDVDFTAPDLRDKVAVWFSTKILRRHA